MFFQHQFAILEAGMYATAFFQIAEQDFTHEQGFQLGSDDAVHLAGSVFGGEAQLQQVVMGRWVEGQGDLAGRQLFLQLSLLLVQDAGSHGVVHVMEDHRARQAVQEFGRSLKVPWNPILAKDSTYPIQEEWNISNAM